jgi:hypothetical protein
MRANVFRSSPKADMPAEMHRDVHSKSNIMRIRYKPGVEDWRHHELLAAVIPPHISFGICQPSGESGCTMPKPISLSEIPQSLYPDIWAQIRPHACSDIGALTYLNAPCPDEESPSDFFFGCSGSFDGARHCYLLGRRLLDGCRDDLIKGRLRAVGLTSDGQRAAIPALAWGNLWPMFATNWASGPNSRFYDVRITESLNEIRRRKCIAWLSRLPPSALSEKKSTLFRMAIEELSASNRSFNEAYNAVLGRPRGRPRKTAQK